LSESEWAAHGEPLGDPDRSAWDRADWWASGDHLGYGARKKIIESPGWSGPKDARHCQNLASVARKFPKGSRQHEVSISHYQAVQGLSPEIAHSLLADAAKYGWTVARLRKERPKGGGQSENPYTLGTAAEHRKQSRQKDKRIRELEAELADCHRVIVELRGQITKYELADVKRALGMG
jgi:hypothetical protein